MQGPAPKNLHNDQCLMTPTLGYQNLVYCAHRYKLESWAIFSYLIVFNDLFFRRPHFIGC